MEQTLIINNEEYVLKSSIPNQVSKKGEQYCMVRTYSAGVFCGWIDPLKVKNSYGVVREAKRIWKWAKAATLSELAMSGTGDPDDCKVPMPVGSVHLYNIIEIIPMTDKAITSINKIPVWKA